MFNVRLFFLLLILPASAIEPSRYAGEDPSGIIDSISATFAAKSRPSDPFGQLQDPDAKPVAPKPLVNRAPKGPSIPLAEIVSRIQINTIMPKARRFLVGSRVISQGDRLPVTWQGKLVHIEIVEVSSSRILFRNPDNGETYAREIDLLPPGMTRGGDDAPPPGMVPNAADAPLQLDPHPSSNPANR